MYLSVDSDFRRTFEYDDRNRMINFSFFADDKLALEEKYTYHPEEGYIVRVDRFKLAAATGGRSKSNNTILIYDKFGHPIDEILVSTNKNMLTINRYYEYTYDKHNNWIECRMFLEGKTDEPTGVIKRIIEYYDEE